MRIVAQAMAFTSLCLLVTSVAAEAPSQLSRRDFERVLKAPSDEAIQDFLRKAPKVTLKEDGVSRSYYVTEGDLLFTEAQMRAHIYRQAFGVQKNPTSSGELLVNAEAGKPTYWAKGERKLSYAIDRASFSADQYAVISKNLARALKDWETICPECGLTFAHQQNLDSAPDANAVTFVVKYAPEAEGVLALAFFPNVPVNKRILVIGPEYFTTDYDKVGLLRHEAGHILGYRHENNNAPASGCFLDESNNWKRLSEYDPHSVMHYFCGSSGSMDFSISATDREGHRTLYK